MGKKIQPKPNVQQNIEEQELLENKESNKKSLTQFLPHTKYVALKAKNYKKKLSKAIKNIQLNKFQIKKAVECIYKFAQQHKNPTDLTGKDEIVYLCLDVSRIPQAHSVRPIQIKLPYPIYSPAQKSRYSVITSDENQEKFTESVQNLNVPMLRDILSYQKIRKNYKNLKDKRQLLAANDLLFCDWRVYNLLRQPLGKIFYEQKKYPYPIDCQGEVPQNQRDTYSSYEQYINGLANFSYTMLGNGPSYTIKAAKTKMGVRQSVKNIMHGSYQLIANILGNGVEPENVRQISIKTYNSPSLPIYSYLSSKQIETFKKG